MSKLVIFMLLFGCTSNSEKPIEVKRRFHVLNGYSSFQPDCAEIKYMTWGIKGINCVNGNWHGDVLNPTVAEEAP